MNLVPPGYDSMQAFHGHLKYALTEAREYAVSKVSPFDSTFEAVFNARFNETLAKMVFVNEDPTRLYSTKCIAIAYAAAAEIRKARDEAGFPADRLGATLH